jgi:hypothetical protein
VEDPLHRRHVELADVTLGHPTPAIAEAQHLEPVHADALAHHGADRGVQAGAVAPAGQDADARHGLLRVWRAPAAQGVRGAGRTWIVGAHAHPTPPAHARPRDPRRGDAAPAVAHGGAGGPLERRLLADPELANDPRVQRLVRLEAELHDLRRRCAVLERETGAAALAYVEAARAVDGAEQAVNEAHDSLDDRIRTAYQLGPGVMVEALLGAESFADLASISEYTSRTVALDARSLHEVVVARAVAEARRASAAYVLAELNRGSDGSGPAAGDAARSARPPGSRGSCTWTIGGSSSALRPREADARRTGWDAPGPARPAGPERAPRATRPDGWADLRDAGGPG